jgi:LysR family transcriptional regulator, cyn operon transcriptional activator
MPSTSYNDTISVGQNMDLRQLEMFKAVAEVRSFTRAGEKLYVTHSAICRQIKLLEDELRTPLFTRANRQVSLTPAGKVLLEFVGPIFEQLTKAANSVLQISYRAADHLNIGTGTTMLNFFLPPILEDFKRRYPATPILVKTGHSVPLSEDLRQGALDVMITSLPLPLEGRDLAVKTLYREELVAVVGPGHPLAGKKIVQCEKMREFPLIIFPKGSSTREILDAFFRQLKISPIIQLELENDEAVERAIQAGIAISFLPKNRATRDKVPFLRIAGHQIFRDVGIVHVKARRLPDHVCFFEELCCERVKS